MANMFGEEEPYRPGLFVNRKEHIRWISRVIQNIQSGGIAESPIVNIWGVRGIGKSWFIAHLEQSYQYDSSLPDTLAPAPTFTLFHQFPKVTINEIDYEALIHTFLDQIQRQLGQTFSPLEQAAFEQADKSKQFESLVKLIKTLSERFVPVILLDQTELVFDDWGRLEKSFIEPLAIKNRIVFIIAGRRPIPEWIRFEARRRVAPLELSHLNGFTKGDIQEQMHRLGGQTSAIDDIYKWSATSPLIAKRLLRESQEQLGKELFTPADWKQHQSEVLPPVYQEAVAYLFEGIPERLIEVLKAVSALRYYRLEGVRYMLQTAEDEDRPYNYYLKLIRSLEQKTEYVWWNRERRSYTTSRVVRSLLNQEQLLVDPDLFVQQHLQAIEMYNGWVNEFPEASEDFILEIWFHRASIYSVTEDAVTVEQELQEGLNFALANLSYDRADALFNQFSRDKELRDLLPHSLFSALNAKLENALEEGKGSLVSN